MKRLAQAHSTLWRFRKAALALCVAIVLAFTPWALSLPDTPARAGFDLYPETDNRAVLRRAAASGPGALFPAPAGTRAFDDGGPSVVRRSSRSLNSRAACRPPLPRCSPVTAAAAAAWRAARPGHGLR